jgi:hypothetical protein
VLVVGILMILAAQGNYVGEVVACEANTEF